jgi:zinc transport system ATP-binding protein
MLIDVKSLNLKIDQSTILENIEFSVPTKSFLSIVGPNGAGKSMLVQCLLGSFPEVSESIKILGSKPSALRPEIVGYVPQFKNFDKSFPAQAIDLIVSGFRHSWPFRITKNECELARSALDKVQALQLEKRQLSTLSGGELQKVYLARALIKKREVIILDEPSTGIDTFGEADLYSILENELKLNQTSIIMVTHDLEVAKHHSTHVLLLNKRQIAFGAPSESLHEEAIHRAFGHSGHRHGDHGHA